MDVPLEMGSLVYFFTLTIVESFKEIKKTKNKDLKLLTIVYFFWTNEGFKGTLKNNSFLRTKFFLKWLKNDIFTEKKICLNNLSK